MQPIIRKAKLGDLPEISKLNLELFKFQHRFDPTANLEWARSREGQKYFKARIQRADGFVEVAENAEKKIVGYIMGVILKRPLWRIDAQYAELESVFVKSEYQGAGLGAKLTSDFINWCQENKVNYVSLLVDPKNETAVKFYKKIGFSDYDLVMQLKLKK